MNPSRLAQNILRRLSNTDQLFIQFNSNYQSPAKTKFIETDILPNKRFLSTLTKLQNKKMSTEASVSHSNRLALEKSPYLLQHATNPVDWYPWCEEAFEKARKENKIIFLSVGYSTCHWCHVMEKESFENESVAEIMNRYYVNIKVDREERPDIDKVYMSFIHATSGSGGWPMSVFLTPNLEPITGGTYFPPEDKWGRPGFKTILKNIAEHWSKDEAGILNSGKNIITVLKKVSESAMGGKTMDFPLEDCWRKCLNQFNKNYEANFGGFSSAPKFPQPSNFNFLFHLYSREKNSAAGKHCLDMCLHTLKCMANGGIHDHVANGFARYSTDTKWHVPHFEKMLYDQAQIVSSYCDAYVITKDEFYKDIIHDILLYVNRDLSHETGGFYSAEDADSLPSLEATEKKEGAFCVWEYDEIYQHLTDKVGDISYADIFSFHYNVKKNGNVNPQQDPHNELQNKNVLIVLGSLVETSEHFNIPMNDVKQILEKCRKILFEVRLKRPRPHLDSKILTAWNGLMISGFAKAGLILNEKDYIDRALSAANFMRNYLFDETNNSLHRCCYRGSDNNIVQNSIPIVGFLDDYAFLIRGLIDLFEASHDIHWLEWAEKLQDIQDEKFWDTKDFAYFTSPEGDSSVLIRCKEDQDGAEPCGNSIAVQNLMRLSAYLDRPDLRTKAEGILAAYSDRLQKVPIAIPEMTSALMLYYDSPTQIFIVGSRQEPSTIALLDVVRSRFLPGRLLVLAEGPDGRSSNLHSRSDLLARLKMQDGRPTAYVCRHTACSLPITEPDQLVNLLEEDTVQPRRDIHND